MEIITMSTNTATIIRKNQKHLMDHVWYIMSGEEGVKSKADAFVKYIDAYIEPYPGPSTAYAVLNARVSGGEFLIYTDDIRKYLHSLGLTDDRKLDNFKFEYWDYGKHEMTGPTGLYMALLARDGNKLYQSLKKGRNPLAPAKKKKTVAVKGTTPMAEVNKAFAESKKQVRL